MKRLIDRFRELEQIHWRMCEYWFSKGDRVQSEASRARATTLALCALDLEIEQRRRSQPIFRRRVSFWAKLRQWLSRSGTLLRRS